MHGVPEEELLEEEVLGEERANGEQVVGISGATAFHAIPFQCSNTNPWNLGVILQVGLQFMMSEYNVLLICAAGTPEGGPGSGVTVGVGLQSVNSKIPPFDPEEAQLVLLLLTNDAHGAIIRVFLAQVMHESAHGSYLSMQAHFSHPPTPKCPPAAAPQEEAPEVVGAVVVVVVV